MNKIMENNEQALEEQNTATSAEQTENSQEETIKSLQGEVAKYKAISERKDKKLQTQSTEQNAQETFNKTNTDPSGEFREELIMIAQGRSKEEVDTLKVIAKGRGISLADAEKDPMFATMTGVTKAAETKQKAQLGASNRGVVQTTSTDDRSSERSQKHAEILRRSGL